jgi:hypothetical protein
MTPAGVDGLTADRDDRAKPRATGPGLRPVAASTRAALRVTMPMNRLGARQAGTPTTGFRQAAMVPDKTAAVQKGMEKINSAR